LSEIRLVDVSFRYLRREVFRGLNLEIPTGRTILLGPNGAGKSTMMKLLVGKIHPRGGEVKRGSGSIGWLPQDAGPIRGLKVREQVAFAGWLAGMKKKESWAAAPEAIAKVGMDEYSDSKSHRLSGGQQKRMLIAQTLVCRHEFIVLDEPFSGLDVRERVRLREILRQIDDTDMLVSTHLVDDVDLLYNNVIVLDEGKVKFNGSVTDFLEIGDPNSPNAGEVAYLKVTGS